MFTYIFQDITAYHNLFSILLVFSAFELHEALSTCSFREPGTSAYTRLVSVSYWRGLLKLPRDCGWLEWPWYPQVSSCVLWVPVFGLWQTFVWKMIKATFVFLCVTTSSLNMMVNDADSLGWLVVGHKTYHHIPILASCNSMCQPVQVNHWRWFAVRNGRYFGVGFLCIALKQFVSTGE